MKKRKMRDLVPPGIDPGNEWGWLLAAYLVGAVYSTQILTRYFGYYDKLFETVGDKRYLIEGAGMYPFQWLIRDGGLEVFWLIPLAMSVLALAHYLCFRRDSMSIYLMRRLPDRWELHRRCWAVPILGSLGSLAVAAVLTFVYYLIYILVTPAQCLPGI